MSIVVGKAIYSSCGDGEGISGQGCFCGYESGGMMDKTDFIITLKVCDYPEPSDKEGEKLSRRYVVNGIYSFDADSYLHSWYARDLDISRYKLSQCKYFVITDTRLGYLGHKSCLFVSGYAFFDKSYVYLDNIEYTYLGKFKLGDVGFFERSRYLRICCEHDNQHIQDWALVQLSKLRPTYTGIATSFKRTLDHICKPPVYLLHRIHEHG